MRASTPASGRSAVTRASTQYWFPFTSPKVAKEPGGGDAEPAPQVVPPVGVTPPGCVNQHDSAQAPATSARKRTSWPGSMRNDAAQLPQDFRVSAVQAPPS